MDPSPSQAFLGPALTCALDPMRPDQSYSWLKAYITGIELRPSRQNRVGCPLCLQAKRGRSEERLKR